MPRKTLPERFWEKVKKTDTCWVWIAGRFPDGYGTFWDGERSLGAHRFAYEWLVGPVPEGLQIDHLCRNRACVNPDHLEPVTQAENRRRGNGGAYRWQRAKTHCPKGHPYDEENTEFYGHGWRRCRICRRDSNRRAYEKWLTKQKLTAYRTERKESE